MRRGAGMSDVRLKKLPYELDGQQYTLRCNMNVLADVQEAYGGDLAPALSTRGTLRSGLEFLAAMLNDDADQRGYFEPGVTEQGYPCAPVLSKRFTAKALGRRLRREQIPFVEIMKLVTHELTPDTAQQEAETESGN